MATVIPIGILVVAFESRELPQMVPTGRIGSWLLRITAAIQIVGSLSGIVAVYGAVRAVSRGEPLHGIELVEASISGWCLMAAGSVVIILSIAKNWGWLEAMSARALRQGASRSLTAEQHRRYVEERFGHETAEELFGSRPRDPE